MKKFTLFLAALMTIMSVNAAAYLKGSFNGWGDSNPFTNGKATVTLSANATFEFKINDGSNWYGNNGTMTSNNCTGWGFSTSAGNAKITTTIAGEYVFTWNSSTKKVSVTYPTEAVKIDYYIAGTIVTAGWNEKGQIMTENNGLYTYTASNLAAGNYEFKITNGTWNTTFGFSHLASAYQGVTGNNDNNIVLKLAEPTDLTITFNGSTISLNLPEKTYTIYFVDQDAWGSVNAYVWTGDPYKSWPGEAMTKVVGKTYNGKDVYEYTYPAKYDNVIFNGGGKQTGDLKIEEGKFYYYDKKWNASITYDASVEPEPDPEPTTYAVKFDNTNSGWAKVYAYCWNGEGDAAVANAAWPGVELTNPENNVYTYSTTTAYENVIFNAGAGKPQTANLVFENGKTYSIDVAYVLGTVNYERIANNECWSVDFAEHKMTYDANTGIWTKTYTNLPAGDYEFKLYCGGWLNSVVVDSVNSTPGFKYDNLGDNVSFTLSDVTNVTITYNSMLNTFAIVGQGIDKFGELAVTSYTLCGSKAIFGGEKDFDETLIANDMTEQDGVWTKTYEAVQLEAYNEETEEGVTYEYKVAANHKWNGAAYPSASARMLLWVAEAGKYNLTFTYEPNKAEGEKLTCVVEKVAAEPTIYAVKFDNTNSGWAKVYAYCWNGEGESVVANAEWPGVELTNPENNVYTYSTTTAYENVIFNAGAEKPQTANLVFENGKTYSIDVAYVLGTVNYETIANDECWTPGIADYKMTYDANTGIWTKTYTNLPAGDYQFKLYCGDWLNTVNVDSVNSTPGFKYDNLGDNISFTLSEATTVTITYNSMLNTFAIVGQGIDKFGELVVTSYTLCGSKAIFGGEKDFDETLTANDMTEQDGVWTKTYEAVQLESYNEETEEGVIYEYKVAANHAWNGAAYPSADVRVVFWVAEAGKYNLTFTYNPNAEGFKLNHVVEKVNEGTTTEVENAIVANVYTQNGLVVAEGEFQIYTVTGQNVTDMNGNLANGVYVVRTANAVAKVVVR